MVFKDFKGLYGSLRVFKGFKEFKGILMNFLGILVDSKGFLGIFNNFVGF